MSIVGTMRGMMRMMEGDGDEGMMEGDGMGGRWRVTEG